MFEKDAGRLHADLGHSSALNTGSAPRRSGFHRPWISAAPPKPPLMRSVVSAFASRLPRLNAASLGSAICVCQTSETRWKTQQKEGGEGPNIIPPLVPAVFGGRLSAPKGEPAPWQRQTGLSAPSGGTGVGAGAPSAATPGGCFIFGAVVN